MVEDLGRPSMLAWELDQQEDPVEGQQQQAQGVNQPAHGLVGAREEVPARDRRRLKEKVWEGDSFSNMQVHRQASDPRYGLSPESVAGAGVGAVIEGLPAGAKAGVETGGQIGGVDIPKVCAEAAEVRSTGDVSTVPRKDSRGRPLAECGCLLRTEPPPVPDHPPFELLESNVKRVEEWFLEHYAASAFNNCPHQTLPLMSGMPPLCILTRDNTEPHAIHKPARIPVHWLEDVRKDLERDVALGVIERVRQNTPVMWCARMHVVGKKDGKPQWVVDLRHLNKSSIRQTHYTEPPFGQASAVPPNTWRFSSDVWNGYHSVPVDERDRHLRTFLTPWG